MVMFSKLFFNHFIIYVFNLSTGLKAGLDQPLWVCWFRFACPSCAVFGNERDVGIVAFVLCLQTGQVSRGWHTPCGGNFTKRLQAMAGGN